MQPRSSLSDWIGHRKTLRRWRKAVSAVQAMSGDNLRKEQTKAQELSAVLAQFNARANGRQMQSTQGANVFHNPHGTDWQWRPEFWQQALDTPGISSVANDSKLGSEVKVFHDCPRAEITCRQLRNTRPTDLAPYGLRAEVFNFEGSFLSLVIDLPPAAMEGLLAQHLIRLSAVAQMEKPQKIIARLNVKHGPNSEQIGSELSLDKDNAVAEFDLAYGDLNENRVESAWIDLLIEDPEMSMITLRDLTCSRRLRAEF